MERRQFVVSSLIGSVGLLTKRLPVPNFDLAAGATAGTRKILIAGGNYSTAFIRYMATLTGKARPKLLFLPTASADRADGILSWFKACAPLNVEPSVQESFIASTRQDKSWSEVLLSVDGIVASGGNTLNQQAIWKAQGIDVVLRQTEQSVVIEVKDRGIGIDSDDLAHIFEPYYRAQFSDTQTRRGAGLGLTLVQQIVVSHGGRIEVDSATGVGSTFRMLFPRGRTETQQAVPSFAHAPQAF